MKPLKLRKAKYEHGCWECRAVISKRHTYYANGKGATWCEKCGAEINKKHEALHK